MHPAIPRGLVIVLVCGGSAAADEILFKNGDRLTGKIDSMDGTKLVVDSTPAGKVSVDLKDVSTFSTDEPVVLKLADGTVSRQRVGTGPAGQITVVPVGGGAPRTVPVTDVKSVSPPGAHWSGTVTVGGLLARGNTDTDSFNASAHFVRRGEQDRLTLDGGYIFGREHIRGSHGKHETADDLFGEAKYDYFFTDRLYGYADLRAEHDTIAGIDLRLVPGVGIGYQWVESPTFSFNTEAGVSFLHRSYSHDGSDDALSARLAYHLTAKLNDKVGVFHDFEYFPGLNRIDNYFIDTDAGIRASITEKMFTEFKIDYRYDSKPAPGRGPSDLRYILGVGWNF